MLPSLTVAQFLILVPATADDKSHQAEARKHTWDARVDEIRDRRAIRVPAHPVAQAVLRQVAENQTLNGNEFNRAFVLMQYFGYLRRDPNAAPDSDFNGYNFWLSKLNQFGGNFVAAEMVKAFINSTEYRQRFGP